MSYDDAKRKTTRRQYHVWMRFFQEKGLVNVIKPRTPGTDGPPIVTKEHILNFNKQLKLAAFQRKPAAKKR